jgi:hypothetical protein
MDDATQPRRLRHEKASLHELQGQRRAAALILSLLRRRLRPGADICEYSHQV